GLLGRRFVRNDPTIWPPFRLHEDLRRCVVACDDYTSDGWSATDRQRRLAQAIAHLETIVLSVWRGQSLVQSSEDHSRRVVAAFLLVLHAAAEYRVSPTRLGALAYTLRELGYGQVLASLPEYAEGPSELAAFTAVARLSMRADMDA